MNELHNFYNDILRSFDFSITGYKNIEEKLDAYFNNLCNSIFFVGRDQISFISYAFAKLKNAEKFEIEHLNSDSFFYNSFSNNSLDLLLLDDYYAFKFLLEDISASFQKQNINQRISTAEIAVQLFHNPAIFRTKCTADGNCNVVYDQHNDLISIEIPFKYLFNNPSNESFSAFKSKIFEIYDQIIVNEKEPNKIIEKKANNLYHFNSINRNDNNVRIIKHIEIGKIVNLIKILIAKFNHLNSANKFRFFGPSPDNFIIENFAKLIISQAFSSYLFDCWIENIPSVVKVDESLGKKWCIGNIVIGYNYPELTISERVYFRLISDRLSASLAAESVQKLIKDVTSHAIRAAISQVMARNMSHNHGSHVLSKLTTAKDIGRVTEIRNYSSINAFASNESNTKVLTKDELLAYFMIYQKQRMDFLADIATATPTLENSKFLMKDIMSGIDNNRILLEHISGTDINYSFEIKDCRSCELDNEGKNSCNKSCNILYEGGGSNHDILVSMPNDVLGQHAFYVIIENIIRNTAKHATFAKLDESTCKNSDTEFPLKQAVKFIIEVHECATDKSLYEFLIYDNCIIEGKKPIDIKDNDIKKKYEKFIIYNGLEVENNYIEPNRIDALIYEQNYRLNQSILDPTTNQLRHGAWGLVEMDVSAAYLRKIDIAEINDDIFEIPLIKSEEESFLVNGNKIPTLQAVNKNNCLAYRFHLYKPKEILILDWTGKWWNENFGNDEKKLVFLRSHGILVLHNSVESSAKYRFNSQEIYPHHILLWIENVEGITDSLNPNLSNRIITKELFLSTMLEGNNPILSDNARTLGFEEFFNPNHLLTFKEQCWRCWIMKLMNMQGVKGFSSVKFSDWTNKDEKEKKDNWGDILFDDHGKYLNPKFFDENSQMKYLEVYNHNQQPWYEQTQAKNSNLKDTSLYSPIELFKLIEGVLSPVVIIDERVQSFSESMYKPQEGSWEKKYSELFLKSGVIIPSPMEANLNAQNYLGSYKGTLLGLADGSIQGLKNKLFLIIHLGVIEKLLKVDNKSKERNDVLSFIKKIEFKNKSLKVIITSGRGKPDNLPPQVPFLSFSIVSQYTIENSRFKAFLVQALQAARPLNS